MDSPTGCMGKEVWSSCAQCEMLAIEILANLYCQLVYGEGGNIPWWIKLI